MSWILQFTKNFKFKRCVGFILFFRVNVKNEKPMQRIDRIFHTVTTTDDPIIRKLVKSEPKVRECNESTCICTGKWILRM